jgi:general secretion pathway protein L
MPEKILGLDISEDSLTAVQVETGLKGYQIKACARVRVEANDGLEDALKKLFEENDLRSDIYLTSISGEHVSCRNLRMPFKDGRKIRQTLPYEMESMVPFPIEGLVIDFAISDRSDHSEILAVSVKKEFISEILAHLQNQGIDPDVLDIRCVPAVSLLLKQEGMPEDGLFLEIGENTGTMALYLNRRLALVRAFALHGSFLAGITNYAVNEGIADTQISEKAEVWFKSFCKLVENTLHAMRWQGDREVRPEKVFFTGVGALYPEAGNLLSRFLGIPAEQIDLSRDKRVRMDENVAQAWNPALMDNALALSLRNGKQAQGFNLRRDEFAAKREDFWLKKEFRRVMVYLVIILSFLIADMGVDYYSLKKRYGMLDQRIKDVFEQTFPDVSKIVDPLQQMKVKINELKTSAVPIVGTGSNKRVLELLREISQRVPKSLDVQVSQMVIDLEAVRVSGKTDTFNTVDNLKNSLEASTYFSAATISSANLDRTGNQVQFEIRLQRAR